MVTNGNGPTPGDSDRGDPLSWWDIYSPRVLRLCLKELVIVFSKKLIYIDCQSVLRIAENPT